EAQRQDQKASSRDEDRRRDSLRQNRQLALASAKKRRDEKEKIDRHIRQNEKRHERNRAFPVEIECPTTRAMRRDPVATAVNDQEQDRQSSRDCERFAPVNAHVVQPRR